MASAVRLQLVNRLGSARGGAELFLQSPALQAQEQRRQEHFDVVEGRCSHQVSAWLDPPRAWVGPGMGNHQSFPLEEGQGGLGRGCRGPTGRVGCEPRA